MGKNKKGKKGKRRLAFKKQISRGRCRDRRGVASSGQVKVPVRLADVPGIATPEDVQPASSQRRDPAAGVLLGGETEALGEPDGQVRPPSIRWSPPRGRWVPRGAVLGPREFLARVSRQVSHKAPPVGAEPVGFKAGVVAGTQRRAKIGRHAPSHPRHEHVDVGAFSESLQREKKFRS